MRNPRHKPRKNFGSAICGLVVHHDNFPDGLLRREAIPRPRAMFSSSLRAGTIPKSARPSADPNHLCSYPWKRFEGALARWDGNEYYRPGMRLSPRPSTLANEFSGNPARMNQLSSRLFYGRGFDDCGDGGIRLRGAELQARRAKRRGPRAEDFSLELNGRPAHLSDLRGKVVVLNFWATWCPPCVEEIGRIERAASEARAAGRYRARRQRGMTMATPIKKFLREHNVPFPNYRDPSKKIAEKLRSVMYPETYIIGPDGRIARKIIGAQDWGRPGTLRLHRIVDSAVTASKCTLNANQPLKVGLHRFPVWPAKFFMLQRFAPSPDSTWHASSSAAARSRSRNIPPSALCTQ